MLIYGLSNLTFTYLCSIVAAILLFYTEWAWPIDLPSLLWSCECRYRKSFVDRAVEIYLR